MMSISLDFHGVIDADPELYRQLAESVLAAGGRVYIISGALMKDLERKVRLADISYTKLISVTDWLLERKLPYVLDVHGRPSFDLEVWNSAKGNIIRQLGKQGIHIAVHYDDTLAYEKYFPCTTRFAYVGEKHEIL